MQNDRTVKFLKHHDKAVKSVSFNPKQRYIFCSGSGDGKLNIYGAYGPTIHYLLASYSLAGREHNSINGVKFTSDGKILAALSSKKLLVLDAETGRPIHCYEDCCYSPDSSKEFYRVPIATNPFGRDNFNFVCANAENRGVSIVDLRFPVIHDFNIHPSEVRDICFIDRSWPIVPENQDGVAILSHDGRCRITTINNKCNLPYFEVNDSTNTLALTPEPYNLMTKYGFRSSIMLAGSNFLSTYNPESNSYEKSIQQQSRQLGIIGNSRINLGFQEYFNQLQYNLGNYAPNSTSSTISNHHLHLLSSHHHHHHLIHNPSSIATALFDQQRRTNSKQIKTIPLTNSITQLKYSTNGALLYATSNSNQSFSVLRFRRYPNEHQLTGELYSHKAEIYDMDISPYDEFLITASKDRTVGVCYLGLPSHGTTSVSELT